MSGVDLDYVVRVLAVMARADMHGELWWRTDRADVPVAFWVMCNDAFAWATADAEPVTPESVPELERAVRDVEAAGGGSHWGPLLYCARRRRCRLQGAAYPSDERLWPLFDACGPQREVGLGNPYRLGERPRQAQPTIREDDQDG